MSKRTIIFIAFLLILLIVFFLLAPFKTANDVNEQEQPVALPDTVANETHLPDTTYIPPEKMSYIIVLQDSTINAQLSGISDMYEGLDGIYTFRGTASRNASMYGKIKGIPSKINIDWTFKTAVDTTETPYGTWGGGTGWTGQPLYIKWDSSQASHIQAAEEIIVGSLCGYIYFIDFKTGQPTRTPFYAGNPVKGTPSIDPALNGNLYIGQGIPIQSPFGGLVFNLFSQKDTLFRKEDRQAWRGWHAFDASPIIAGSFLFWAGENGTIYKFSRQNEDVKLHSLLRYRVKGKSSLGIESSLAVWKNYGYFGDNSGNIICINLNNLKPVWCYDNHDDTDATVVVDVEGDVPFIYTGSEVDHQEDEGFSYFTKLNGLTGENVWTQKIPCRRIHYSNKSLDGGMFSTPLPGVGDCSHLIFSNFCTNTPATPGEFIAFGKTGGEIIYRTRLKAYAWSSPVAMSGENGEMYIFTGDVQGNVYLIKGSTGEIILTQKVGLNFESSPVATGNSIVMGSRGNTIYKMSIE